MKYGKELLQFKQIVLWGTYRHIYEFTYMFENMFQYRGYIPIDQSGHYTVSLEKLEFNVLEKLYTNDIWVIICDLDINQYLLKLQESHLIDKINYVHFTEFFELLDDFNDEILCGRKIAVWGTGDTERNFNEACKRNGYSIDVSLYIDNNCDNDISYHGQPVKLLSDVEDIAQYFVIVASIYYRDISNQLTQRGLIEGRDYLPFSIFWSKPSAMLKYLIYAKEITDFYCNRPYTWFYYAWYGSYPCCSTWLKYPIGNPAADSPEQCWNSTVAKLYRLSADNGTYCFCKKDACGRMNIHGTKDEKIDEFEIPQTLLLGLDFTCNLSCTSCREHIQVATGNQLKVREGFADKIIRTGWLEKTKKLELSGTGEALASKIDRKILFSNTLCKRESISLLTNGILLNNDNLQKLKQHFKKVRINISIDAATEETYKKIRRGGNWSILIDNLENLSIMRRNNEIEYVEIRMVIQKTNYKEIPAFIQMGKKYHVDHVVFTKLLNWDMYSKEEYLEQAMLNKNGYIKTELEHILRIYALNEKIAVISEFEHFLK